MMTLSILLMFAISIADSDTVMTHADSVCFKRGHIEIVVSQTLLYCPPTIVDLEDQTIEIYYDRNTQTCVCKRCGRTFYRPVMDKPDTTVIWAKDKPQRERALVK